MKLIFVSDGRSRARSVNIGMPVIAAGAALVLGVIVGVYDVGSRFQGAASVAHADPELVELRAALQAQQEELRLLRASADEHIDALALRMGQLNAHVIRLNALGSRLTDMADLDDGEFDFANAPALGGPDESAVSAAAGAGQLPELLTTIETLDAQIDDQLQQLTALEGLLLNRKLSDRAYPRGRPVRSGWLSSYFGKRADPVTGRSAWHKGIDFAGKYGDDVIAVSDGVVSYSGKRSGFGNLVEIRHGNGYVTRYAHNQENLVAVGDTVTQGQTIALLGSTGRSTGPHVHFEVHRNGRAVDPAKYVSSR